MFFDLFFGNNYITYAVTETTSEETNKDELTKENEDNNMVPNLKSTNIGFNLIDNYTNNDMYNLPVYRSMDTINNETVGAIYTTPNNNFSASKLIFNTEDITISHVSDNINITNTTGTIRISESSGNIYVDEVLLYPLTTSKSDDSIHTSSTVSHETEFVIPRISPDKEKTIENIKAPWYSWYT